MYLNICYAIFAFYHITIVGKVPSNGCFMFLVLFTIRLPICYTDPGTCHSHFILNHVKAEKASMSFISFVTCKAPLNRTCFAIHNNVRTLLTKIKRSRGGRGRMAVAFTTTCTISPYHHERCEFESRLWRGVFDTTLCDKSLSVTCVGFLRFSPPLKLTATI